MSDPVFLGGKVRISNIRSLTSAEFASNMLSINKLNYFSQEWHQNKYLSMKTYVIGTISKAFLWVSTKYNFTEKWEHYYYIFII